MDLEEVWRIREEEVYPRLFGPGGRGIFALGEAVFRKRFGQQSLDPRWPFLGVFEFAPTPERASWLYVTSGYSNPWDQEPAQFHAQGVSGSGVEFVLQTPAQGEWAISLLQTMLAWDVLLAAGRFAGQSPLSLGDRVPLKGAIDGAASELTSLVLSRAEGVAPEFELPSGKVALAAFTGITEPERELAATAGLDVLLERLRAAGAFPVTDSRRSSVA